MNFQKHLLRVAFVVAACAVPGMADIVANGGFETSSCVSDPNYVTVTPNGCISSWIVQPDSVDYIKGYWTPQAGSYSIDLSGSSSGSISQALTTVVGQRYALSFWVAGNPDQQGVQTGSVSVGGAATPFSFDTTGWSRSNMGWTQHNLSFVATTNSTILTFASTTGGAYGPALDSVSVNAVPEPAAIALFGLVGAACVRLRRRTA